MKHINILLTILLSLSIAQASDKLGDHADGSQGGSSHSFLFKLLNDKGLIIDPFSEKEPFSIKMTCGRCHDYDKISTGMHFNAGLTDDNGRAGEPWIFVDAASGTQIPLSHRDWKGLNKPGDLLIPPDFASKFGRFSPGNIYHDENFETGKPVRSDINCLTCHSTSAVQSHIKYAGQIKNGMFKNAAAASSNMGSFNAKGEFEYNPVFFNKDGMGNFEITRHIPNTNCLKCHSNAHTDQTGEKRWTLDGDVHIQAGMNCVDCHRNGLNHAIVRGYEGEKLGIDNIAAGTLSCAGCHIGTITKSDDSKLEIKHPISGRFGAPYPKHAGIPPVHFRKLSCTACHSGRWPGEKTGLIKTSRGHFLGMLDSKKAPLQLPHIYSPVLAEGHDGKLAPHKMVWPAFWAWKNAKDEITVIDPEMLPNKFDKSPDGSWPEMTEEDIAAMLKTLEEDAYGDDETAVYICNGKMHSLKDGKLVSASHEKAEPYKWAVAHNVRPAQQSMGARGNCSDCHTTKAGFFFGEVDIDGPLKTEPVIMADMQASIDGDLIRSFNFSFIFRPIMKYFSLLCSAVLLVTLAAYGLKALTFIFAIFSGQIPASATETSYQMMGIYVKARRWVYMAIWLLAGVLGLTGFGGWCSGALTGWALMIHCTAAPMFLAFVTLAAIFWAGEHRFIRRDIFSYFDGARKICFWAGIALVVVTALSSVICMFPILGTGWQIGMFWTHRIATILLTLCGVAHLYFIWVAKTHEK